MGLDECILSLFALAFPHNLRQLLWQLDVPNDFSHALSDEDWVIVKAVDYITAEIHSSKDVLIAKVIHSNP